MICACSFIENKYSTQWTSLKKLPKLPRLRLTSLCLPKSYEMPDALCQMVGSLKKLKQLDCSLSGFWPSTKLCNLEVGLSWPCSTNAEGLKVFQPLMCGAAREPARKKDDLCVPFTEQGRRGPRRWYLRIGEQCCCQQAQGRGVLCVCLDPRIFDRQHSSDDVLKQY